MCRVDPSPRGVLSIVVCLNVVISKPQHLSCLSPSRAVAPQEKYGALDFRTIYYSRNMCLWYITQRFLTLQRIAMFHLIFYNNILTAGTPTIITLLLSKIPKAKAGVSLFTIMASKTNTNIT